MESIVSHCHLAITFWLYKDGRPRVHVRTKPQRFTVASNQTVHVDMSIDTGIR
jgi:hypothetical protein